MGVVQTAVSENGGVRKGMAGVALEVYLKSMTL